MFKTKEKDIDKANIKIEVLEWQFKVLMEIQGDANNERDSALGDARRVRKELREYKELESKLQKEVDRLHVLLQERRELKFGLGRDERKRLHDELEGSRSLLEKSQSYRVSNANEIITLRSKLCQLQTNHEKVVEECEDLLWERDTLLKAKQELAKRNQGLELDIEGMKDDYMDIVTECCDLIREREGFLMGKRPLENDKKGFIERETRIISRTELMIILEDYYKVTEVELGEVRVGTPTHYINTHPFTACSSQLVNIQIAYRKKVDKE